MDGQLRRSFARNRNLPDLPCDDNWDYYDPWIYEHGFDFDYYDSGDAADLARFELDQKLSRLTTPPVGLCHDLVEVLAHEFRHATSEAEPWKPVSQETLIEDLWTQSSGLAGSVAEVHSAAEKILRTFAGPSTPGEIGRIQAAFPNSPLVKSLCWFAPFWIRDPADWHQGDARSLVDHLLVRYEVPSFLYCEWTRDKPRSKWISWFILLAQGADLKLAASTFGWQMHRRFVQYLFEAPDTMSPTEACVYAEVRRLGGNDIDAQRLISNPAFVIDPTELSAEALHYRFWHESACWLISKQAQLSDEESDLVLSWAMHEFTEEARFHRPFSLKGRSVRAALERSVAYREQATRPWAQYSWLPHTWNWSTDSPSGAWDFVELTSGKDLFEEGQALSHCVATYAARCATGYSAIVSMRCDGIRQITIEIQPQTKRLVQARGLRNRSADDHESDLIRRWISAVIQSR
ncbi:MAG: PcfJ domain-containing protein [Planctomycetes bacterium]|nr:PcfJ domain-containing protein [Planctomycetota bacterium]